MGDILQGLYEAGRLIVTLDADLLEISLRSLYVTLTAVAIAALIGLPMGAWVLCFLLVERGVNGRSLINFLSQKGM